MLKRIAIIFVGLGVIVASQTRGTPSQLRVNVDANGYLLIVGASQTNPVTSAQFINARLNVDSNGNLGVICVSGCGSIGAPTDATYITQTANSTLTNEQAIAALSSGILRGATTTGVITSLGDVLPVANGGLNLSAASDDNVPVGNGTTWQSKTLTACNGSADALTYNTTTNAFGCHAITGIPGGSGTQVQFNDGGAFGGDAGFTYNKTTDVATLGGLAFAGTFGITGSGNGGSLSLADGASSTDLRLIGSTGNSPDFIVVNPMDTYRTVLKTRVDVSPIQAYLSFEDDIASQLGQVYYKTAASVTDPQLLLVTTAGTAVTIKRNMDTTFAGSVTATTTYLDASTPTSITSTSMNSCGTTSPTFNTGSSNSRGSFNVGATSGTDCSLTFSVAAAHFWACTASNDTTGNLTRGVESSTTVTKFLGVFGGADKVTYVCFPY